MPQLAGDERLARIREVPLVVAVEEGVAVVLEQGLVRVHPRAVLAEERLRHEGRVEAGLLRDLLLDQPVGHGVVGHRERVRVTHVDLVLRRAHLVMDVFDRDAHRLERAHRLLTQAAGRVERGHREVPALVQRLRSLVVAEEEVLELGPDVERVEAERAHPFQRAPQHVARIALVRLPIGRDDVADHPRDLRLALLPRHQLEGLRIGDRDHVGLLDRVEARNGGPVEAHPIVECVLDLARSDGEALQVALDVGEPEQNELHALFLDSRTHALPRLLARRRPVLRLDLRH